MTHVRTLKFHRRKNSARESGVSGRETQPWADFDFAYRPYRILPCAIPTRAEIPVSAGFPRDFRAKAIKALLNSRRGNHV